jgi:polar amino acid transport system permease protein
VPPLAVDWGFLWEHHSELLDGLQNTLEVAAIGVAGAFVIGLVLGAARAHRIPVISPIAAIYVEVIRNTPILVQIFFVYFGLPRFGIYLDPYTTACLVVVIWGGAFNTENFRAGFEAVPGRFREAAAALGFGRLGTFALVTFPIGGRIAIPSSINTYISVLKNTALFTAIGFADLTNTAYSLNAVYFKSEVYIVIAVAYLTIVWGLSAVIRVVERRLRLPEDTK